MESTDPPEDDLPPDEPELASEEDAEDELPPEIEMEPEEISSGIDVISGDGAKKKRMSGPDVIRDHVTRLPSRPGVYRMFGETGELLYVGKARNLKARVSNYAKIGGQTQRIARMISLTRSMEFVVTATRDRGAAAGSEPDQAAEAALQHHPARRQEFPAHSDPRRPRSAAGAEASRGEADQGAVFWTVRIGGRGRSHAGHIAEGVPAADLHGQHLRDAVAALHAASDGAVLGAVYGADPAG